MHRKQFIKTCGFACLSITAISTLLQSCSSSNYFAHAIVASNQIIIKKSEFVKTNGKKSVERNYVLVKNDNVSYPIYVCKVSDNNYSALLMECTHNSCELNPQGSYLVCPCHGSEFSNLGLVQNPPAEQNLKTFKVKTDHDNIYIQL